MAEYESQQVKDMDRQVASDEVRAVRGQTDNLQDVFTRKPKCLTRPPDPFCGQIRKLLRQIYEENGMTKGDCGGCGFEDVYLYVDLCRRCTAKEIRKALEQDVIGPLLEKYGL